LAVSYENSGFNIRADLAESHQDALEHFAAPGTWLDGAKRVAVAAEVRNARQCPLCKEQKAALSPNAVQGEHSSLGELSAAEVEFVHRIVSDPGRLSESWYQETTGDSIAPEAYIEMVGIIAMTMMMDTFTFAMGLPDNDLLPAKAGEPTGYRSPGARKDVAWVPITEPKDVSESDGPLYPSPNAGYIHRALSAVPDSKRGYWDLAGSHYLPGASVYDFDTDLRAISRPQIEVIAARVSALHQCLY